MFSKPFEGEYPITSHFGYRINPITGTRNFHRGTDFGMPENTPLYAVESGTILRTSTDRYGGLWIDLLGQSGRMYRYLHLNRFEVSPNQQVTVGQRIGLSGNTGFSTGAHLHFEEAISRDGERVDPIKNLFTKIINPSQIQAEMSAIKELEELKKAILQWFEENKNRGFPNDDGNTFGYLRGLINGQGDYSRVVDILLDDYASRFFALQSVNKDLDSCQKKLRTIQSNLNQCQADLGGTTRQNEKFKQEIQDLVKQIENLKNQLKNSGGNNTGGGSQEITELRNKLNTVKNKNVEILKILDELRLQSTSIQASDQFKEALVRALNISREIQNSF